LAKASSKRPRAKKAQDTDQVQDNVVEAAEGAVPAEASADGAPEDTGAAVEASEGVEAAEVLEENTAAPEESAPAAEPMPEPAPQVAAPRRGPGFFPLVLGGVVAAGIGYGAAYLGYLPVQGAGGDAAAEADVSAALDGQAQDLSDLIARTEALEAATGEAADVDLSAVETRIETLSSDLASTSETLESLSTRIEALEARPAMVVGEGGGADANAMTAALSQLQTELANQQAANEAMTDEIRSLAQDAETRIAEAEQRAEVQVGNVAAQAALSQLMLAMDSGAPFSAALNDAASFAGVDVPAGLEAVAQAGVPKLEELQTAFPSLAREALPVALRETAGEGAMDRIGAFFMGQVGGRSLTPQEGDSPDAILSRSEDAVRRGALDEALSEIAALPAPVQDIFATWVSDVQSRQDATSALDSFATALGGGN